jgi:hypothetical protein
MAKSPMTAEHYMAFGAIVQHFAFFERLVEFCIAYILSAKHAPTALAVSGLGYTAKTEALTSLIGIHNIPAGMATTMTNAVDKFKGYYNLRKAIAHQVWLRGSRPESIKVISISAKGGKAKVRGTDDGLRDYTVDELIDIANELLLFVEGFASYLRKEKIIGRDDSSTVATSALS